MAGTGKNTLAFDVIARDKVGPGLVKAAASIKRFSGTSLGGLQASSLKVAAASDKAKAATQGFTKATLSAAKAATIASAAYSTFAGAGGAALAVLSAVPGAAVGAAASIASLKVAFGGVTDAVDELQSAAEEKLGLEPLELAMRRLSPEARNLAIALQKLRDPWIEVRKAIQQTSLKGVSGDLEKLSKAAIPPVTRQLAEMGKAWNMAFRSSLQLARTPGFLKDVETTLGNSASGLKTLSGAFAPLLSGLRHIAVVSSEAFKPMAQGITDAAKRFESWAAAARSTGELRDRMASALSIVKSLARIVGNVGGTFAAIFNAGGAGQNFLAWLADGTAKMKAFFKSAEGQSKIKTFYGVLRDLGKVGGHVARSIGAIFQALDLKGGAAGNVGRNFLDWLLNASAAMEKFLKSADGQSKIKEFWNTLKDRVGQFWETLKDKAAVVWEQLKKVGQIGRNVVETIAAIIGGASTSLDEKGKDFLTWAVTATEKMKNFFQSTEGQAKVKEFFETLDSIVNGVALAFQTFFEAVRPLAPVLGLIWDVAVPLLANLKDWGPALGIITAALLPAIAAFRAYGKAMEFIDLINQRRGKSGPGGGAGGILPTGGGKNQRAGAGKFGRAGMIAGAAGAAGLAGAAFGSSGSSAEMSRKDEYLSNGVVGFANNLTFGAVGAAWDAADFLFGGSEKPMTTSPIRTALREVDEALGTSITKWKIFGDVQKIAAGSSAGFISSAQKVEEALRTQITVAGAKQRADIGVASAFMTMTDAARENGTTLALNTRAGQANRVAILGAFDAVVTKRDADLASIKPGKDYAKQVEDVNRKYNDGIRAAKDLAVKTYAVGKEAGTTGRILDEISGAYRIDVTIHWKEIGQSIVKQFGGFGAPGKIITALNAAFQSRRAEGGPVRAGQPYLVGEDEPELFVPNASGRILNQKQMRAAGASGGGVSAPVVLEFHGTGEFGAAMVEVMRRAVRVRGGNVQAVLGRVS